MFGVSRALYERMQHPSDDDLELWCLGRMLEDEKKFASMFEHLLFCRSCRERAERMQGELELILSVLHAAHGPSASSR